MKEDLTYELRTLGLKFLFQTDPDMFPYIAVEHLDDFQLFVFEPASTALQLLASSGHHVAIYHWLVEGERPPGLVAPAIEILREAPREVIQRYIRQASDRALKAANEQVLTALAETIVELELNDAYGTLHTMISSKISDELHGYLALLLAGTNRPALLAILEEQLTAVRRRQAIVDALRVRTTPEQEAILRRWEARAAGD